MTVATVAFVQIARIEALPPPLAMRGPWGWLRVHLFSSSFNIGLSVVMLALIAWIAVGTVDFLILDAVWGGGDRTACMASERQPHVGACWPFVWERLNYFT